MLYRSLPILFVLTVTALAGSAADFSKDVQPVLKQYCTGCHGAEKQKGEIRLDTLDPDMVHGKDAETWQLVLDQLNLGEMPPPKKKERPTDDERRTMVNWLTGSLMKAAEAKRGDTRTVMRRLTKEQYSNALRDLLQLDIDFGRDLPDEMVSDDGFSNNGADQVISLLQTEYYMAIAEMALKKAIVTDTPPRVYKYDFTFGYDINKGSSEKKEARKRGNHEVPVDDKHHIVVTHERLADSPDWTKTTNHRRSHADLRGDKKRRFAIEKDGIVLKPSLPHLETGSLIWLAPAPSLKLHLRDFPTEGDFVLRVTVAKADDSDEDPFIRAMVGEWLDHGEDYEPVDGTVRVTGTRAEPQTIEFRGRLENFPIPIFDPNNKDVATMLVVGIWNDCLALEQTEETPSVLIKKLELECGGPESWPPEIQKQIFVVPRKPENETTYSREIIEHFIHRAFRRPAEKTEVDAFHELWKSLRPDCASFEQSIRETLAGVLVSPHFLYLVESAAEPKKRGWNPFARRDTDSGADAISEHQLASRLAAFLWNSVPDAHLLELAGKQQLRKRLSAEFARMIADRKSQRFVESFCGEWLQIEKMTHTRIDRHEFPRYNRFVRDDMIRETELFFEEVLQENLSVTTLIDANFTMLNQNLAQFYGMNDVRGGHFRKVALKSNVHRGGLLSHGVFLAGNSSGREAHPIKRGAWLISRVLDDPPPPPPPNVPNLDEDDPEFAHLSVKDQLAKHRENPSCADCHNKVDPWGLLFENYNAVGLWKRHGPVDTTLPNGKTLGGVAELKRYLVTEKKDQFTRGLVRYLLRYALGRSLSFTDNTTIDQIVARTKADDYRFQTMLLAIVESELFRGR
jgi:hypothetical protein